MRLAARPAFRSTRAYARASLKISREKVSQLRYSPRAWANRLDHVTLTLGGWPWPPMRFGSPSFPKQPRPTAPDGRPAQVVDVTLRPRFDPLANYAKLGDGVGAIARVAVVVRAPPPEKNIGRISQKFAHFLQ